MSITSPAGDARLQSPPTVLAADLRGPFDVVLLSCKAYDLDAAIEAFAPALGPETAVLPLLNGMRHLDALDARFGPDRVLGGACFISARLDDAGQIAHLSDVHRLVLGERTRELEWNRVQVEAEERRACVDVRELGLDASSHLHENLDHLGGPLMYTVSTLHCMTVSLAQGGEGLGTMWGDQKARELLAEAGFSSVERHQLEHDPFNAYYVVRP